MAMPEPGRQAAHVLLDATSVFRPEDADATIVDLALQRLGDAGAVSATFNDVTGEANVDVSDLVGATLVLLQRLVTEAAREHGVSKGEIIADLRAHVDDVA
jgi:hypothetical protein